MAQPFDLTSFIALQKQYISDLSGITISAQPSGDAQTYITNLGRALNALDASLNDARSHTDTLLLQQNAVNSILTTENDRLDSKKASIDNAITGQKRLMQLNDTYRKRYSAYINLVLIIVLALIIIIVLIFINKVFPFIPEFVYTLLYIIILSGTAIYCWFVINDIQKRDKFDYDKHTRPAPATPAELKKNAEAAAKAGNLLASIDPTSGCRSEGCCADGTTYDATQNKCIIIRPFTTIEQAYSQEPELRKTVEPYTPCEFEGYSKL